MFNTLANIFQSRRFTQKNILYAYLVLIVYRFGAFIPVPNINTDRSESFKIKRIRADVFWFA